VRLSDKDQGDGIAPTELPKLVAGLGPGRGLRIARDIAERHGGTLVLDPGVDGARFVLRLPAAC
jgi:two-component system sensor kinase FixL